jgi:hypothetical protein
LNAIAAVLAPDDPHGEPYGDRCCERSGVRVPWSESLERVRRDTLRTICADRLFENPPEAIGDRLRTGGSLSTLSVRRATARRSGAHDPTTQRSEVFPMEKAHHNAQRILAAACAFCIGLLLARAAGF